VVIIKSVDIFKALADENRLRIISLLLTKELCVCEIEASLEMSQSNVSRHLTKLKTSGIVDSRKDSQWVYYKVSENFRDNNIELINYLIATFRNESLLIDDIARLQKLDSREFICK